MEQLAGFLSDKTIQRLAPIPEKLRRDSLASFSRRPSPEILRALSSLAAQYEEIRRTMKASSERTSRMGEIVYRVQTLIDQTDSSALVLQLFSDGQDGLRIVALAAAEASPLPEYLAIATVTIAQHNEWLKFALPPRQLGADEKWNVVVSNPTFDRKWVLSLNDVLREHGFLVFADPYEESLVVTLGYAQRVSQAVILVLSSGRDFYWNPERNKDEIAETMGQRKKGFQFISITLDQWTAVPSFADGTVLDFSSYPDGPNGGELLRLLYAINGMPLSVEAARFASQQDDVAQEVAAMIGAAIRNNNPDRVPQLFEQGGLVWETSSALGCKSSEALIKLGRNDEAIQILGKLGERFPKSIRPKQLLALALTRRGSSRDLSSAQDILGVLYERGARDIETLTLYAGTWAERFYQSHDKNDLRQSRDLYMEASQSSRDDNFSTINVASISAILGVSDSDDQNRATEYAERVQTMASSYQNDYWKSVAQAESFLIQRKYSQAAVYYKSAIAMARSEIGSHMTTWKQACRLMEALKPFPDERALIRTVFEHLPECDNRGEIQASKRS